MRFRAALAAAGLIGLAAVPSAVAHTGHDRRPGATKFDIEVRITHQGGGGFAPAVAVDRFGNQYAVARKDARAAAYDDRSAAAVRTRSWAWSSADGGATWQDLAPPPTAVETQQPSDGADVTATEGMAYVADATGPQTVVARYRATALGQVAFAGATSVPGTTGVPQIAAHGRTVALLTPGAPGAAGATVRTSTDGGVSFGSPVTLPGTVDCSIAVAARVLATCTNGSGRLVALSSSNGQAFTAATMGSYDADDVTAEAPSVAWARNGTAYALSVVGQHIDANGLPSSSRLSLHRSTDGGRTWSARDVGDPDYPGRYEHGRLAAGVDGSLGVAAYYLDRRTGWHIVASVFPPDRHAVLEDFANHTPTTSAGAPRAPGGRLGVAFGPETDHSRLSVVWTVAGADAGATAGTADTSALRDVWFVRSQPPDLEARPLQERTPVGALPPCRVAGQVGRVGAWDAIKVPPFRARSGGAGAALAAYAVDAYDPARMYATNGTTVARSLDAGCTWTEVFSLEAGPGADGAPAAGAARIVQVLIPEYRNDHRRVLLVLDEASPQGRPHVLRSDTGDRGSFTLSDSGLPAAGHPRIGRISPANPDFVYLAVSPSGGALPAGGLYASEDGGASWAARTPTAQAPPDITVLAVDPGAPNSVWVVADGRVRHSTNGGRSFDGPAPSDANQVTAQAPVTAIDVSHAAGEPARITAWSGPTEDAEAQVWTSTDGGQQFDLEQAEGLEGPVESAVHGSRPDIQVVSTAPTDEHPADLYHLHLADGDWDGIAPPVKPTGPFGVSVDRRAHPAYYAMTDSALLRYAGAEIEPGPPAPLPGGALHPDPGRPVPTPVLAPAHTTLHATVGSTSTVNLSLTLPPRPQRVDLYLLVDTSESMKGVLDGLRSRLAGVAATLRGRGVDVWAGVGGYKTDQDPPKYHRYRDVGPVDADLAQALGRLDASQGAGLETQLIALHQTVTGAGLAQCTAGGCLETAVGSTCDADPDNPLCSVPPGQQADFRDGAVKVVLHATDAGFRNPEGTPRNRSGRPDIDGVAAEFARAGILQIGLVAGDPKFADTQAAEQDLGRFATRTGALATSPVDCNADGRPDLRTGQPLVCPAGSAGGVGDAVLNLLSGLPDPGRLVVTTAGPTVTAARATERIDLHTRTARSIQVQVRCEEVGQSTDVVTAGVEGGPTATALLDVSCDPVTAPTKVLPAVLAPLALAPVLPPAPAPLVPAQPALNPQAQLQTQAQVQGQLQFGAQEEEQLAPAVQLAADLPVAEEGVRVEPMSRRDDAPTPAYLLTITAVTAVASVVALRRKAAAAHAVQVIRARR